MKTNFVLVKAAAWSAGMLLALGALAQGATDMANGEVRKIDKEAGKITIKHGDIKSLDMPPMTMVFNVKDKSLLDKAQVGEKIKFTVISEGGKLVVTDIQATKP